MSWSTKKISTTNYQGFFTHGPSWQSLRWKSLVANAKSIPCRPYHHPNQWIHEVQALPKTATKLREIHPWRQKCKSIKLLLTGCPGWPGTPSSPRGPGGPWSKYKELYKSALKYLLFKSFHAEKSMIMLYKPKRTDSTRQNDYLLAIVSLLERSNRSHVWSWKSRYFFKCIAVPVNENWIIFWFWKKMV